MVHNNEADDNIRQGFRGEYLSQEYLAVDHVTVWTRFRLIVQVFLS